METFTPGNNRGRFGSRSGDSRREFGGRSSGGFSRGRDRDSERDSRFGRSERRPLQMHDATCSECGKQCEIPFRPTGSRPVFCSDCFRKSDGGSGRNSNRSSRDDGPSSSSSGASSNQFAQINAKLDKILQVLQSLEIVTEDDEDTEEYSKNNSHAKKEVTI